MSNAKADLPISVEQWLRWAASTLVGCSSTARLDAEVLLANCLQVDRLFLVRERDYPLSAQQVQQFEQAIGQRQAGLSVAYIVGFKEFRGLSFKVNQNVLVPRPETELLVQDVLDRVGVGAPLRVLDLGVGSGCISIALAIEWEKKGLKVQIDGVDISSAALEVAQTNAEDHGVSASLKLICSDWFEQLNPGRSYDLIVSNPPYVAFDDPNVSREVAFEPIQAIYAAQEGLEQIYRILNAAPLWLNYPAFKRGQAYLWCEVGAGQSGVLREWFNNVAVQRHALYRKSVLSFLKDFSGHDRILTLTVASN